MQASVGKSIYINKTVFIHMQKTGGSTIDSLLRPFFLPEQVCPERYGGLSNWPRTMLDQYDLFTLHGSLGDTDRIPGDKCIFAVLRDPITRLTSYIDYMMSHSDDAVEHKSIHPARILKNEGIEAFFGADYDHMRRAICSTYAGALAKSSNPSQNLSLWQDSDALLDKALQGLENLDFVGISEYMSRSVELLGKTLGVNLGFRGQIVNKTMENWHRSADFEKREPHELTDRHRELINEHTKIDQIIYNNVLSRFKSDETDLFEDYVNLQHAVGRVRSGPFGQEIVAGEEIGFALFGPWIRLPAGSYLAEFLISDLGVSSSGPADADWLSLEVAHKSGTSVVARQVVPLGRSLGKEPVAIIIPFDAAPMVPDFEFRIHKLAAKPVMVVNRVRLRRVD